MKVKTNYNERLISSLSRIQFDSGLQKNIFSYISTILCYIVIKICNYMI